MPSYIISYDLKRPGKDYPELYEALEDYGTYWHHLDSTWIIKTSQTASQICDNLVQHIDSNDQLLVAKLTGEAAWFGINEEGSQWLKDNL